MTSKAFLDILKRVFGSAPWPKPLHLLRGCELVREGQNPSEAAKAVGTSSRNLEQVLEASNPLDQVLGMGLEEIDKKVRQRTAQILGQLLLGRCAEMAFEKIYQAEMGSHEFQLRDLRESRTDTDYRLYNGQGMPVYRINIKFHGSRFRRAPELVGLNPQNCFALATYKIHSALQKQQQEGLPYFFAVVGVPHLSGESVGGEIPKPFVEVVTIIHQAPRGKSKRDFEDAIVSHLVMNRYPVFEMTYREIVKAEWYILSARRADKLLRELLFERVFALRIRSFAQVFRGAELDMHFSLSQDLISLREFLRTLKAEGPHKVTTFLERGEF